MTNSADILDILRSEFPEDRLTFQKSIPTFHPESSDEAAKLFRLANKRQQRLFITGFGNNIDPVGEAWAGLISVRTDRLNNLLEIAPEDFYVRVGAGYPLRELKTHLKQHNLFFPHAVLPYVGSVGGAIAIDLTAEHHGHKLPIKRFLIQAEVVTPEGAVIKPGSVCFKSVSGYDIVKLFAHSWGLLGLIVTATFRVFPSAVTSEYDDLRQLGTDRKNFWEGFHPDAIDPLHVYSHKIKNKLDPSGVLPIVRIGE